MKQRKAATQKAAARHISSVTCKDNSTDAGFYIKRSHSAYSAFSNGKRIASALTREAAFRIAIRAMA